MLLGRGLLQAAPLRSVSPRLSPGFLAQNSLFLLKIRTVTSSRIVPIAAGDQAQTWLRVDMGRREKSDTKAHGPVNVEKPLVLFASGLCN